jgi:hypothetical protein
MTPPAMNRDTGMPVARLGTCRRVAHAIAIVEREVGVEVEYGDVPPPPVVKSTSFSQLSPCGCATPRRRRAPRRIRRREDRSACW